MGLLKRLGIREERISLRSVFNEMVQTHDSNAQNLNETDLNPYYAAFLCGVRMYGKDGKHRLYPTGESFMEGLKQEFPHFGYPAGVREPFFLFYRIGQRLAMRGELTELSDRKVKIDNLEDEIKRLKFAIVETPSAVYATKPVGNGPW